MSISSTKPTVVAEDGGGSLTVDNPTISVVGSGTEATAQRVTIATDSTGVLSVDDNGSSLTVDYATTGSGNATGALRVELANNGTGVLATLGTITNVVHVDDNAGSLTVDGTVTANQGSAGTAWEVVGDVAADAVAPANPVVVGGRASTAIPTAMSADGDSVSTWLTRSGAAVVDGGIAHDAVDAGGCIKIGGRADTTFQTAVADADRVDALFDVYGAQYVRINHPNLWSYHENSSSALTDTTVQAAPGAGLSIYVTDIIFSNGSTTALNLFIEESTTTTVLGPFYLEAINGRSMHLRLATPKKITANTLISVTTSAAVAHSIDILGFIAP